MISIVIILVIFTGCLSSIISMQRSTFEMKNRTETYLCFKFLTVQTNSYIKWMARQNILIASAFVLTFNPPLAVKAKAVHKILKYVQRLYHISHLAKLSKNKYCKLYQRVVFLKNLPFKTNFAAPFILKRGPDGSAVLRKQKWTIYLPSQLQKLSLSNSFLLKGQYFVKNAYSSKVKLLTREINVSDLQKFL